MAPAHVVQHCIVGFGLVLRRLGIPPELLGFLVSVHAESRWGSASFIVRRKIELAHSIHIPLEQSIRFQAIIVVQSHFREKACYNSVAPHL